MTAVDILRAAAARLREREAATLPGPWWYDAENGIIDSRDSEDTNSGFAYDVAEQDASWIVMMSPQLAAPLAAWLGDVAADMVAEQRSVPDSAQQAYAVEVAQLIMEAD